MDNIVVFKNYYNEIRDRIKDKIDIFNKKINENKILKDNIKLFSDLNSNGKLIRGTLINLGYRLIKNEDNHYSDNLSLAYEVFETSILIHDDIIDKDNLRRGKDTIHFYNYKKYEDIEENKIELNHVSNSIGICMGDYGLYLSNKIISDSYSDDKNLGKILSYYNDIVLKTIEGETLDTILAFECKKNISNIEELEKNILTIYKLKTSYYTIIGPLCIGMILAGASSSKISEITKFGEKIGIAYQIQDDILGIYSDNMGKITGSDIKEFKQTILYSYVKSKEDNYNLELLKYYGKDNLDENIINDVRRIFDKSGAKDYSINMMNSLYDEGLNILENISWLSKENKNILMGFVEYLKERNR